MYLSKLELHGFKSFADRTVLTFDPGITAIVGPNGCGKSNIVDAVRWAIGEQRARILRSEKMENVIFNGTAKRRPLGMSEVLLTVQNSRGILPTEYGEVTLGRRLYRSGDSDYLLNDVQCRLKDITDLFMDTGMGAGAYSVIELKMVDEILSENAQDRRRLFEEAAGITRYKLRRKQTLSKLDGTQVDLSRVRDLTDEVGKQVRSLKRQAEKAARYKEYSSRLREVELALAQLEYDRLRGRLVQLNESMAALQTRIDSASQSEREGDEKLTSLRAELAAREESLEAARKHLAEHVETVRKLETEQRLTLERLDGAHRDLERMRVEESADAARRNELTTELAELEEALSSLKPELDTRRKELDEARRVRDEARDELADQRKATEALRQQERSFEQRATDERRKIDRHVSRREFLEAEIARITAERTALETSIETIRTRASDFETAFERAQKTVTDARAALQTQQKARADAEERRRSATEHAQRIEKRREGVAAEVQLLEQLVSSFEEFPDTVRFLAEQDSWKSDSEHLVTVADVISCAAELRPALDAALGDLASCVVVKSAAQVDRAAALLRSEEKGRATFLVLDRLPPSSSISDNSLAAKVRSTDVRYEPLISLLLGHVILAQDLQSARSAATTQGVVAVTPNGEWVRGGGLEHTGSADAQPSAVSGRMQRRDQLDERRAALTELDAELAAARAKEAACIADVEQFADDELKHALHLAEQAQAEIEKDEARAVYELEVAARRLAEHDERSGTIKAELVSIEGSIETERLALDEAERMLETVQRNLASAEKEFVDAEQRSAELSASYNELHVSTIQVQNRLDGLLKDTARVRESIEMMDRRAEERSAHVATLSADVGAWQEELDQLRETTAEQSGGRAPLEEAVETALRNVAETKQLIGEVEAELKTVRAEREDRIRKENQFAVQRAEVETRLEDLVASVREDYDVSLGDDDIEVGEIDEAEAREAVHELRQRVRGLGAVNELALESYEEERARLDFLEEQQRDLEAAEKTLIETIGELNTTASQLFMETYDAIQVSFRRIFADLFGEEASAELVLDDPSDPLESTIEIKAKPKGKRPSTIAQLSGGEKTLTAIALLFAIYLVKPSPFCILDEVDAPLDDANVERFMQLIRTFSENTQFILVTHNKRTMEAADRLYGITMQEQGVSKLVAVEFEDAAEMIDGL